MSNFPKRWKEVCTPCPTLWNKTILSRPRLKRGRALSIWTWRPPAVGNHRDDFRQHKQPGQKDSPQARNWKWKLQTLGAIQAPASHSKRAVPVPEGVAQRGNPIHSQPSERPPHCGACRFGKGEYLLEEGIGGQRSGSAIRICGGKSTARHRVSHSWLWAWWR